MTDLIKSVRQFTEAVGCTTDQFNVRQTALYIGLQCEELAEKLEEIFGVRLIDIRIMSEQFKIGEFDDLVRIADRSAMLDADIDLAWVTLGSAFSQGADVEGAAGEVARANLGKLVVCDECGGWDIDETGESTDTCQKCGTLGLVAIKDANGKVKEPEGWIPPNIEPFVCKE